MSALSIPDFLCAPGHLCAGERKREVHDPVLEPCGVLGFCQLGSERRRCPPGSIPTQDMHESPQSCSLCPAGFYCDGLEKQPCEGGYYCTGGSTEPRQHIAPPGTYAPTGSVRYTECPAGVYQPRAGQDNCQQPCEPGFYCPHAKNDGTLRLICPKGKFCLGSTFLPEDCPVGTVGIVEGLRSQLECKPCPPGFACPSEGLTSTDNLPKCAPGYYCQSGAATPQDESCPPGHYCPAGASEPRACPAGTLLYTAKNSHRSACVLCPAGKYCPVAGLTTPPLDCHAGYFCPPGSRNPRPFSCQPGSKCPTASKLPIPCRRGEYQPFPSGSSCLACPAGFECSMTALALPSPCRRGGFCESYELTLCPVGTYQPH